MNNKIIGTVVGGILLAGGGTVTADQIINPYDTVGTTLQIADTSVLPEAGTDKITVDETQPKITLSKWNGEVAMGVALEGVRSTGGRPFLSKNVTWTQEPAETMEAVPLAASTTMEDGGMEINIDLASKPASNIFNFAISGADDLDFFYQPPLWQFANLSVPTDTCNDTDCDLGYATMHEDENIVGSYIAYSKTKRNHIEGQTNYAAGQAFTIYRPKVTDATGTTVWATLEFDKAGVLSVVVPQDFLDTATYPIVVDPIIGYTTHSGNITSWSINQTVSTLNATQAATVTGAVSKISFWGSSQSATGNFKAYMTNTSDVILGSISPATGDTSTSQEWDSLYSGPTLTSGTSYLAWVIFDSTTFTDGTIGACTVNFQTTSYASPTNPTSPSTAGNCFTIWATYDVPSIPHAKVTIPAGQTTITGGTVIIN